MWSYKARMALTFSRMETVVFPNTCNLGGTASHDVVLIVARAHCWLIANLTTSTCAPFSAQLHVIQLASDLLYLGSGWRAKISCLPLLNVKIFRSNPITNLQRCLWTAAPPSRILTVLPALVLSINLVQLLSIPLSRMQKQCWSQQHHTTFLHPSYQQLCLIFVLITSPSCQFIRFLSCPFGYLEDMGEQVWGVRKIKV